MEAFIPAPFKVKLIPKCSFCGKGHKSVECLFVGDSKAAICSSCVELAWETLKQKRKEEREKTQAAKV